MKKILVYLILSAALFFMASCETIPKNFFKLPEDYLQKRQLGSRKYQTTDLNKILSSVATVLQDIGFILSESETELGLISAYKNADAKNNGQIAGAVIVDFLNALTGNYSNSYANCDKTQKVKASIIVKPIKANTEILVRVSFQRIVWNMQDNVSRVETLNENEIYKLFFDKLSKSIFLESYKL